MNQRPLFLASLLALAGQPAAKVAVGGAGDVVALQDRITLRDLEDTQTLAALAKAANLSPEETRRRFAPR